MFGALGRRVGSFFLPFLALPPALVVKPKTPIKKKNRKFLGKTDPPTQLNNGKPSFKPGCLQFLHGSALLHSFAPFCALLRICVCALLHSFACLVGLRTQTQNTAFLNAKDLKAIKPWPRGKHLKCKKQPQCVFERYSVLPHKFLNRNLSWGFPLSNFLTETRILERCVLERKRRPNANAY